MEEMITEEQEHAEKLVWRKKEESLKEWGCCTKELVYAPFSEEID
ncbi:MAG: hypothetical protein Q4C66_03470 [Lachnospiraceae bacterium]|nr:hypothetical protein [Lachnospiraceae bacterium]